MSVWSSIVEMAARAFDPEADPPEFFEECAPRPNDVGFTAAVIGLAAKMARADGIATEVEMKAAAQVFRPPPGEEQNFRRAFALAEQTILGFDSYAKQIGRKYRARPCLLEDVLDGLFHIAAADGNVSDAEVAYLEEVAAHFGFSELEFRRIKATNLGPDAGDPYAMLACCPARPWTKCATPGVARQPKIIPTACFRGERRPSSWILRATRPPPSMPPMRAFATS